VNEPKDVYFVAVKVLLRNGDNMLISHDVFGSWDIPGGRIKPDEFDVPLEEVVSRKMREEVGPDVKYELGKPVVFFRHERIEKSTNKPVRIFAIGYEAKYVNGDVKLGANHDKYEWVDVKSFKPENYFNGGWLKGLNDYLKSIIES
jgi:8-oxo-dGTP pyrophosphatase MutT (NUDIX family)